MVSELDLNETLFLVKRLKDDLTLKGSKLFSNVVRQLIIGGKNKKTKNLVGMNYLHTKTCK